MEVAGVAVRVVLEVVLDLKVLKMSRNKLKILKIRKNLRRKNEK